MRKNLVLAMNILFVVTWGLVGCEEETVLKETDFPAEIENYIHTFFPDHEIVQVVRDRDDFKVTYDVILKGAISLEFDKNYKVTDLSSTSGLPDSVIPETILEYVKANYPQHLIVEWELDKKSQQIGLDNGLELRFSKAGEFQRIDDD